MSKQNTNGMISKMKKAELVDLAKNQKSELDKLNNTYKQVRSRKDELTQEIVQLSAAHKKALSEIMELQSVVNNDLSNYKKAQQLIHELIDIIKDNYGLHSIDDKMRVFWVGIRTHVKVLRQFKKALSIYFYGNTDKE